MATEPQTAPLADYIRRAAYGDEADPETYPIFAGDSQPTLVKGRVNRILVYRPNHTTPKRGYEAFLERLFEASSDINVVAAMIIFGYPTVGYWSTGSLSPEAKSELDRRAERIDSMWEEKTRNWRCNLHAHVINFSGFLGRLGKAMARDGFEARLVMARHLDDFSGSYFESLRDRPVEMITGVALGAAGLVGKDGVLERLEKYKPWEAVAGAEAEAEGIMACESEEHPGYTVRFVPAKDDNGHVWKPVRDRSPYRLVYKSSEEEAGPPTH